MESNISKWGNSQAVRIPKNILEMARFREDEKVRLLVDGEKIIITKAIEHKTLAERFKGYNGDYKPHEFSFGEPVGKEVL